MSDKELLELAAKAAGIVNAVFWSAIHETCFWTDKYDSGTEYQKDAEWNPIKDDGDALRLAVKLNLAVVINESPNINETKVWLAYSGESITEPHQHARYAATRRAITIAAAEIGKAMP